MVCWMRRRSLRSAGPAGELRTGWLQSVAARAAELLVVRRRAAAAHDAVAVCVLLTSASAKFPAAQVRPALQALAWAAAPSSRQSRSGSRSGSAHRVRGGAATSTSLAVGAA